MFDIFSILYFNRFRAILSTRKDGSVNVEGLVIIMRAYGRFLKNTAALLLLLALLSLLLPFCRFQAAGQDMTLSGVEVVTAGGKAGYMYLRQSGVPDDYVLKDPFTWGDIKQGIHYADQTGNSNLLLLAGAAAGLPVLLCFLSMCMLFLAEGKKTMVLPTLFTAIAAAELLVALTAFTALRPFLLIGVYFFAMLNIIALILIILGWLLGGYRKPKDHKRRGSERHRDSQKDEEEREDSGGRRRGRRRKSKRRKKRHSSNDKKKKEKSMDKQKDRSDEQKKERDPQGRKTAALGEINGGSGMYAGISKTLSQGGSSLTIGTTPEAMRGIETGSLKAAGHIADHNCQIAYDPESGSYTIVSHAAENIALRQDGRIIRQLKTGERVRISGQTQLDAGSGHSLWLR